jgi:hypothetical protein
MLASELPTAQFANPVLGVVDQNSYGVQPVLSVLCRHFCYSQL